MTIDPTKLPADCEVWTSGDVTLIRGDAPQVLPMLSGAIVSDPPYGIKYNPSGGNNVAKRSNLPRIIGDDRQFEPSSLLVFPEVILWGANHYASKLPDRGRWLVWDKRDGTNSNDMADCELAWTNSTLPARLLSHRWMGMIRASERGQKRVHPTQKPVAVMEWCLGFIKSDTIIDPYMGSGTTGVACVNLNRKFIGIEISPEYFEIAKARILKAQQAKAEQLVA